MKEDVAQLRKALDRTIKERSSAGIAAADARKVASDSQSILRYLLNRQGGTLRVKRSQLAKLRGTLHVKENKNGITLTYTEAKKNARR